MEAPFSCRLPALRSSELRWTLVDLLQKLAWQPPRHIIYFTLLLSLLIGNGSNRSFVRHILNLRWLLGRGLNTAILFARPDPAPEEPLSTTLSNLVKHTSGSSPLLSDILVTLAASLLYREILSNNLGVGFTKFIKNWIEACIMGRSTQARMVPALTVCSSCSLTKAHSRARRVVVIIFR